MDSEKEIKERLNKIKNLREVQIPLIELEIKTNY